MGIFIMIIQFLFGLIIIVGLHELGHLLLAKLFGMRVESYMIGFPPKLFGFQWGDTEYAVGAIPLGGAVKISGMVDESLESTSLHPIPHPWEFRAKPAWQRLMVTLGGILFNIATAIIIYSALSFAFGSTYLPKEALNEHGIVPSVFGTKVGFQEGDRILNVNGQDFEQFEELLRPSALLAPHAYYTIKRGDETMRINIPSDFIEQLAEHQEQGIFIAPRLPFQIGKIQPRSGAAAAGLQAGDRLSEVAGAPIIYFHQLQKLLPACAGQQVSVVYLRQGAQYTTTAHISEEGKLGFQPQVLLPYAHQYYSLGGSLLLGSRKAAEILKTNLIALSRVATGKMSASKSLSGPIGIIQVFGKTFEWIPFWNIVAFLSLALALTNLLPIPALDGGHAVWLIYEIITGHRPSDSFLESAQRIGMFILLMLISFAIFNDLYKLFRLLGG